MNVPIAGKSLRATPSMSWKSTAPPIAASTASGICAKPFATGRRRAAYKIYIIDEVHMLTTEAFNALLKTLEEPPEHVVFLFATTEPHKIPATILSRCQRFDFRRIPTQQLVEHLRHIAVQEQVDLPEGVLYAVAREADGSMRDAQSLLEQILAFSGEDLTGDELLDILGIVDRRSVHRVWRQFWKAMPGPAWKLSTTSTGGALTAGVFVSSCATISGTFSSWPPGGPAWSPCSDLPEEEILVLKAIGQNQCGIPAPDFSDGFEGRRGNPALFASQDYPGDASPALDPASATGISGRSPGQTELPGIPAGDGTGELYPGRGDDAGYRTDARSRGPRLPSGTCGISAARALSAAVTRFATACGTAGFRGPGETVNQWPSFIRWLKSKMESLPQSSLRARLPWLPRTLWRWKSWRSL